MYSLEGHLSIADINRDISRRIYVELKQEQTDFSSLRQKARHQIIDFLHWVERGKVVGPNGQLLTVGPVFLTSIDGETDRPTLFSAVSGLVGNEWPSIYRESEKELSFISGIFRPFQYVQLATTITFSLLAVFWLMPGTFFILDWFFPRLEGSMNDLDSWKFSLPYWLGLSAISLLAFSALQLIGMVRRHRSSESGDLDDLRGFALMFEEARYTEYLNIVADDEEEIEPSNAEKAVARQIVDAFDRGEKFTRSEFLDLKTSHGMRTRAFGRAWERAREERPKIGRPGRRTKS
ncbi:hypothetical protein [Boseongicola aestuarii]|uniref:Uncharacterized protein n=1 Tax=Boseongicola aestuarii TaxID=1470561 RepID=A0A238IYA8_9RHOB|nr:hypothetical protein [Boseongicola aestuarii]SMX23376.1 hypothetical protein BOA8489_01482 [Boseongicola aestuarii]